VRELQSAIKYAYVQSAGEVITPECLPSPLRGEGAAPRPFASDAEAGALDVADFVGKLLKAGDSDIYQKVTAAVDRVVMETVLRHVKGNQVHASEVLGISRTTLRTKLRSLGLVIEKQLLPDSFQG
jgi:DNA-binding NtrC family response regulator